MDLIDRLYMEQVNRMSDAERFAITCELLEGVIAIIEHQLRKESPDIWERELRLRTAEILYLNDPGAQRLLQMAREHGAD